MAKTGDDPFDGGDLYSKSVVFHGTRETKKKVLSGEVEKREREMQVPMLKERVEFK